MPHPVNYPSMPAQFPYKYGKYSIPTIPTNGPYRPNMWPMPIVGSSEKNPVLPTPRNQKSSGTSKTTKRECQSNRSECSQNGENKSHETNSNKQDSLQSSDDDSSEGTSHSAYKSQSKRQTVLSAPKAYLMHPPPQHVLAPNCFIHVPIIYRPGMKHPAAYQQATRSMIQGSTGDTSALKEELHSEPESKEDASALKTQIIKNVEQLFEMTRRKSSSTDIPESVTDSESPDVKLEPLGNMQLLETVMKCCLEVETYWTESARECNARALILGCCQSIRRLMSNDFRSSATTNIVASLQELTLSLILLFLISSMS